MASQLDRALDEVIKDRRREPRRTPSSQSAGGGRINKRSDRGVASRLGNSPFTRTVQLRGNRGSAGGNPGKRDSNSQWRHDLFDDDPRSGRNINSRLSGRFGQAGSSNRRNGPRGSDRFDRSSGSGRGDRNSGTEIVVENLHYNVIEKDLQDLFAMVGTVSKARIEFDRSGRSTGVAHISYTKPSDAEAAIAKYNNVELDGQPMQIKMAERERSEGGGGRARERGGGRNRGERSKNVRSETDLDQEMDAYMNKPAEVKVKDKEEKRNP
ncbi:hypothetical protein BCR43DRAFT_474707 [Syncephalastrum racemosum]|uniref:RRM domain-containing protein n=1 Tax=Syncephalastrum racemosum TaxID=13706 RepID=A0A1X2HDC8_SYNRA|nr:hypothetical protein BCR43DRAFT_474707 [Syncephalastrum racemosum]